MEFNCLKVTEPLRGDRLLFISKSPGITGTHLIYLRRMKDQYIFSYFYKSFRALTFFRHFAQFPLKAVNVTMIGEFMVFRLPENAFLIQIEFFTKVLRLNSPQVHIITTTIQLVQVKFFEECT